MGVFVHVHAMLAVTIVTLYSDLFVIFRAIDLKAVPQGLREGRAF